MVSFLNHTNLICNKILVLMKWFQMKAEIQLI